MIRGNKMAKILQLRISLDGIKPEIWRRFLVEDSISFEKLHNIIQDVMGWENYHLYEFNIDNQTITVDEEGYNLAESSLHKIMKSPEFIKMIEQQDMSKGVAMLDVDKMNKILRKTERNKPKNLFNVNTVISKLIKSEKQKFVYFYDFGDNWKHTIVVENIMEKYTTKKYPTCIAGERNCPPEDCGSADGYYELMKIRKNKNHPEYKERIIEWLGEDYEPELFVLDWINAKLSGRRPAPLWVFAKK